MGYLDKLACCYIYIYYPCPKLKAFGDGLAEANSKGLHADGMYVVIAACLSVSLMTCFCSYRFDFNYV